MGNWKTEGTVGVGFLGDDGCGGRRDRDTGQLGARVVLCRAGYRGGVGLAASTSATGRGTGGQERRYRAKRAQQLESSYVLF